MSAVLRRTSRLRQSTCKMRHLMPSQAHGKASREIGTLRLGTRNAHVFTDLPWSQACRELVQSLALEVESEDMPPRRQRSGVILAVERQPPVQGLLTRSDGVKCYERR